MKVGGWTRREWRVGVGGGSGGERGWKVGGWTRSGGWEWG